MASVTDAAPNDGHEQRHVLVRSPKMRFVIIASPRTGSTHLTSLLNEQDGITCHGEIFHPKKVFVRWPRTRKSPGVMSELMKLRERNPMDFLDHINAESGEDPHVGFKIFAGHNDAFLETLIADNSVRKIVLYRSNLLASYSSSLIRGQTQSTESEPALVTFNAARFLTWAERQCAFYRTVFEALNAERQTFFVLNYEQINDPWILSSLVTFIGGDPSKLVTRSRREKLNSSAILERFSNPAEVAEFLHNRGLSGWGYESPVSLDPFGLHDGDRRMRPGS